MQAFNDQLQKAMAKLGRTLTGITTYRGGRVILTGLNDQPNTEVRYEDGSKYGQVKFLGSWFVPRANQNNTYDVNRAVGLLLAEEAKNAEAQRKAQERERKEAERNQWREAVRKINHSLNEKNLEVRVEISWGDGEGYYVKVKTDNQATIHAMIDYLNDGGFLLREGEEKPTDK